MRQEEAGYETRGLLGGLEPVGDLKILEQLQEAGVNLGREAGPDQRQIAVVKHAVLDEMVGKRDDA